MQFSARFLGSNSTFVLIGGGGAAPEHHLAGIFQRFIALAGGVHAPIAILTCATSHPERQGKRTHDFFEAQGALDLHTPLIRTRDEANDPHHADLLARCRGVYMTGGDQSKYVHILAGTRCGEVLANAAQSGLVVGGTSAGAVAVSDVMIARSYDWIMRRRGIPVVRKGLGLLGRGIAIDSHFGQRRRIPRLVRIVTGLSGVVGIGLDEDTALIVNSQGVGEVQGAGNVYLFTTHEGQIRWTARAEGGRFNLRQARVALTPLDS
jgi:cyanophycinase